jgi:spermidine/putrescine transport system ATP-binding protein
VNLEPAGGGASVPDLLAKDLQAKGLLAKGLQAQVCEKSFAGGQLRITARFPDGGEITASRHGIDSPLQIGEDVIVTWSAPSQAVLVEDAPSVFPENPA